MALEIELKARIDDIEPLQERLAAAGEYRRSYQKSNTYWIPPRAADPEVRVRRERGTESGGAAYESAVVTLKAKTVSGGIEVNDEREFTVSDAGLFEDMLERLGMRRSICKEKNGWAWTIPPGLSAGPAVLAELSLVSRLGWFLELEIICADKGGHMVAESRERLLALLAELKIPASRIEDRPYTAMLKALDAPLNASS